MDLIYRFDVLLTGSVVADKHWAKLSKRGITESKRAKIANPYLNAHLHINMISHIYFQEIPLNGQGGAATTRFY